MSEQFQLLTFENKDYEINSLFNFQINFDHLKTLIVSLVSNQTQSNQRITVLEEKINERNRIIEDLQFKMLNQDNFLSGKYKNYSSRKTSPFVKDPILDPKVYYFKIIQKIF